MNVSRSTLVINVNMISYPSFEIIFYFLIAVMRFFYFFLYLRLVIFGDCSFILEILFALERKLMHQPYSKSLVHLVKIATSCIHNFFIFGYPQPLWPFPIQCCEIPCKSNTLCTILYGGKGVNKMRSETKDFQVLLYKFKDIQGLEFLFSNSRTFKDFQVLYGQCQVWQYFWLGF
jgi:hypothetical protein